MYRNLAHSTILVLWPLLLALANVAEGKQIKEPPELREFKKAVDPLVYDFTFALPHRFVSPPAEDVTARPVTYHDGAGETYELLQFEGKPGTKWEHLRPDTPIRIGERSYLKLVHALMAADSGDTIELPPYAVSLPAVQVIPKIPSQFANKLQEYATLDNYWGFVPVSRDVWYSYGPWQNVTIRGAKAAAVDLERVFSVPLKKRIEEPKKKGGFLKKVKKGLSKGVQRGSLGHLLMGHAGWPPIDGVKIDRDLTYTLPKNSYEMLKDDPIRIPRPKTWFTGLGVGARSQPMIAGRCPSNSYCDDFTSPQPFVISGSSDVTIENVAFDVWRPNVADYASPESTWGYHNFLGPLLVIKNSKRVTIRGSSFANAPSVAIVVADSSEVVFENCVFLHSAAEAIASFRSRVLIKNSLFLANGRGQSLKITADQGKFVKRDKEGEVTHRGRQVEAGIEELPQTFAITASDSLLAITNTAFRYSGNGDVNLDCSSDLFAKRVVLGDPFKGPALKLPSGPRYATQIEESIVAGDVACPDSTECESARQAIFSGAAGDAVDTQAKLALLGTPAALDPDFFSTAIDDYEAKRAAHYLEPCGMASKSGSGSGLGLLSFVLPFIFAVGDFDDEMVSKMLLCTAEMAAGKALDDPIVAAAVKEALRAELEGRSMTLEELGKDAAVGLAVNRLRADGQDDIANIVEGASLLFCFLD